MRTAAQNLLKEKRFNQANWDKKSEDAKIALLQELADAVKKVLGLKCTVNVKLNRKLGTNVYGQAVPTYGTVGGIFSVTKLTIELTVPTTKNRVRLLGAILHEARHGYQFESIYGVAHTVTQTTRNAWSQNLTPGNYTSYTNTSNANYYLQAVEWDTLSFAKDSTTFNNTYSSKTPKYRGSW